MDLEKRQVKNNIPDLIQPLKISINTILHIQHTNKVS